MPSFAEVIGFFLVSLVLWTVAFYWLPEMTRTYALTRLHDTRDRLYALAQQEPRFSRTSFYRDIEFIFTASIHVVRDRSWFDSVKYFTAIRARPINEDSARARADVYKGEMQNCFGNRSDAVLAEIGHDFTQHELALVFRVCGGHPLAAVLFAAVMFGAYAWSQVVRPAVTVIEAATTIERAPHRPLAPV